MPIIHGKQTISFQWRKDQYYWCILCAQAFIWLSMGHFWKYYFNVSFILIPEFFDATLNFIHKGNALLTSSYILANTETWWLWVHIQSAEVSFLAIVGFCIYILFCFFSSFFLNQIIY